MPYSPAFFISFTSSNIFWLWGCTEPNENNIGSFSAMLFSLALPFKFSFGVFMLTAKSLTFFCCFGLVAMWQTNAAVIFAFFKTSYKPLTVPFVQGVILLVFTSPSIALGAKKSGKQCV